MPKTLAAINMDKWTPKSEGEIYDKIISTEKELVGELNNFWDLIKTDPKKWEEKEFGDEGGGFWVVAICGRQVIWYNDIEEGFNISFYKNFGQIEEYRCNQYKLREAIQHLFDSVKFGGQISGHASPPINLD